MKKIKKKSVKKKKTYSNKIFLVWGAIIVVISIALVLIFGGEKILILYNYETCYELCVETIQD